MTGDKDEVWVGQQQCKFVTRGAEDNPVYRKYTGTAYAEQIIVLSSDMTSYVDNKLGDIETILAEING